MKLTKTIFGLCFALCFAFSSCNYKDEIDSVKSISKLTDGVYFLEYEGDYCFDKYLEQGGAKNVDELTGFISNQLKKGNWSTSKNHNMKKLKINPSDFGCSSISVKNAQNPNQVIFGRNYDWKDCQVLIIHSKPVNGYESISTCCLSHIGIDENWQPSGKFLKDVFALAAIYVPMDGMNEKGLYIADLMAGDDEQTYQERGNTSLTTTDAIRLILDKAENVDQAISLLENYDMHSVIGRAHHFAISDSSGKAVAVEWVNNQLYVKETRLLTNHYVTDSPKKDDGTKPQTENSRIRYEILKNKLSQTDCTMNAQQTADLLKSVSASQYGYGGLTVWSAIFEPENQKITYYFRENYDKPFVFELQ